MLTLAVSRYDLVLTVHILAVVIGFGGALAYPLWFRMVRDGTPPQRAFFHAAQARLGKFLITPAILLVFATGAYLASDGADWGRGWVMIPAVLLAIILLLGGIVLGPTEERLSREAMRMDPDDYRVAFRRIELVTWLLVVLVVVATFLMVAHIPD